MTVRAIVTLCSFVSLASVFVGCANPSDVTFEKTTTHAFPYATAGFPHPLEEATPAEKEGILLRFKPVDAVLHYDSLAIGFSGSRRLTITTKQEHYIAKCGDEQRLIYDEKTIYEKQRTATVFHQVIDTCGRAFSMDFYGVNNTGPTTTNSMTIIKYDPRFPADPVKAGSLWEQSTQMLFQPKNVPTASQTTTTGKCRLSGFATVRGHRCAVLERLGTADTQNALAVRTRVVDYFDYTMGATVERFTYGVTSSQHVDETQAILTLVE